MGIEYYNYSDVVDAAELREDQEETRGQAERWVRT